MPAHGIIAKLVIAHPKIARIGNALLRRALAIGQRRQCHERFKGRARRIRAGKRAIQHRAIGRVAQFIPALWIDAVDKQVGIEAGLADKREHAAGLRIERHQRAAPVAECLKRQCLQARVQFEHQIGTGDWRRTR